jgi:hypothetical protein
MTPLFCGEKGRSGDAKWNSEFPFICTRIAASSTSHFQKNTCHSERQRGISKVETELIKKF